MTMQTTDLFPLLLPVSLVVTGALVALGSEAFLSRAGKHSWLPWIAAVFLLLAGVSQAFIGSIGTNGGMGQLHGIFAMDSARLWLCEAIIGSALCAMAGLQQTLSRDEFSGGEPYALTMFATAGAMLMTMATDALSLFVALEIASISIYSLVGLRRHRTESNEALFKYFVMGAVFSAIFLYGAALTFGSTGHTQFGFAPIDGREKLFGMGQLLIIIGLLFKLGVVPFHFWSPDAYTGAPAAVTGFMGAVAKVGGFAALGGIWLNLVAISSGSAPNGVLGLDAAVIVGETSRATLKNFQLVFLLLGLLSVVLGNFSALKQTSMRRMIAFSSVAHAGYMLLAFALPTFGHELALGSLWVYLVGYAITTAGALTAIAAMSGQEDSHDTLGGLAGQGRASPLNGLVLTVFMASFAGIPPTMGFLGKFLIFGDLVAKGWWTVALFAMVMAVVGAAFYLRLVVAIWAAPAKEPARTGPTAMGAWALSAAAAATVVLISWPGVLYKSGVTSAAAVSMAEHQP